jgi:hypothetical protein
VRVALVVTFIATLLGLPLDTQRRAEVELQLPPRSALATEGPLVRGVNILSNRRVRDLLRSGFPARLHFRVELWSVGGWFNNLERSTEWDVVVRYDPLDHSYRVARFAGNQMALLGQYSEFADAEGAAERLFRAPITAKPGKRYYYAVVLDVEMLSLSDLDEVERWLRGELRPAVRGKKNAGTALTRGLRTLVVRLLGGEKQQYEFRSRTFRP